MLRHELATAWSLQQGFGNQGYQNKGNENVQLASTLVVSLAALSLAGSKTLSKIQRIIEITNLTILGYSSHV